MRFDVVRARGEVGDALRINAESAREDYLPNGVGNAAVMMLESAVYSWFAGQRATSWPVIRKAHAWLADSIDRHEVAGQVPEAYLARRVSAYAVAGWLLTGDPGRAVLADAVAAHETAWRARERAGELRDQASRRAALARMLRECASAAEPALGRELFSQHGGPLLARLAPAAALLRVAHAACAEPDAFPAISFDRGRPAGDALAEEVDYRLTMGQGASAAAWLRFAFWDTGAEPTPTRTLERGLELIGAAG